ncbi:hypothetical protein OIDMADRAFT_43326 [Oidiodendron maius Zn]|uniref:Rhodopsin domain-containing protein n=1 Tax=Oidiodendron maius (strain Zn) TaxID=913774 RepID=A0A0C3D8K0_OIDMZ|nr:hypothetical protein OIDMADRAFT_43326 [Oidiodendron maius Zn]
MSASTVSTADLPHDSIQPQAIALVFAFPAAATAALALRIYSRALTRTFGSDDWVILFAGVLYWAETFTSYKVIKLQFIGFHVWDIPVGTDTAPGWKYAYATELLYNPILALVKTSILLFLLRLALQKSAVQKSIWALMIFNGIMMVVTFFLTVFHCIPIPSNWDAAAYPNAKCLNFADFVTGTACVAILTDVLVLILPTWIVYNLHIQWKQKLMVIGILSFGLVTVVAGIVRVILLDRYDRHLPPDFSYSLLFCISTIEVGLSFVAACAPALKPIVVRIAPKLLGTTSRSRDNKYLKGGTPQASRLGYRLDNLSRNTRQATNVTQIESTEGEDKLSLENNSEHRMKDGIVMTTETQVMWHTSSQPAKNGTSMESLV